MADGPLTQRLRAEDQAQQIEMVDRHVDQQRLLLEVMAAAPRRTCGRVAAEVDRHLVELAQAPFLHEAGERARRGEVAVVLADHQHEARVDGHVDQLVGGAQGGGERLLEQDVQARVEGGPGHRYVAGERSGVEQRLGTRRRDGLLQRLEDHAGRRLDLRTDDLERVRIGVDVADHLDLRHVRNHAAGPVAAVRTHADLEDPQRVHGAQSCGSRRDFQPR